MFQSVKDYYSAWSSFVNPKFKTTAKLSQSGGKRGGKKTVFLQQLWVYPRPLCARRLTRGLGSAALLILLRRWGFKRQMDPNDCVINSVVYLLYQWLWLCSQIQAEHLY